MTPCVPPAPAGARAGGWRCRSTLSLRRSNAFDLVAQEVRATREAVGLLDISGFSRFEVTGPEAAAWLDHLLAGMEQALPEDLVRAIDRLHRDHPQPY